MCASNQRNSSDLGLSLPLGPTWPFRPILHTFRVLSSSAKPRDAPVVPVRVCFVVMPASSSHHVCDERQLPRDGIAHRYRHPPPSFASAMSLSALDALIDPVTLSPRSSSAHMQNWAGVYASDKASTHDGAFSHIERRVFSPNTIEQVVAIVERARRASMPVRAVGRRHSPSDLPFSLGWTIRTDELYGIVHIDKEAGEACALGGTYIKTLSAALASHDPPMCLPNLGSISEQTIAGLISTASHGSGIHFPVLSAHVVALDVVCPLSSGTEVLRCSRTERPDLFNASLCGLGATGVIVSVTMNVVPAFRLLQVTEEVPTEALLGDAVAANSMPSLSTLPPDMLSMQSYDSFIEHPAWLGIMLAHGVPLPPPRAHDLAPASRSPECVHPFEPSASAPSSPSLVPWNVATVQAHIDQLVESAQHVRFLWSPHANMITIDRANRTDAPADEPTSSIFSLRHVSPAPLIKAMLFASRFHKSLPSLAARMTHYITHPSPPTHARDPAATPGGLHPVRTDTAISVRVDDAPRIFNFDCLCEQYTTEYAIPYEYTGAALVTLRAWLDLEHAQANGERLHFPVEVRFVDADGIWMSPCYGRRSCYIGIVQYRPYGWPVRYRRLFRRFESLMRQFNGRPHWAKTHTLYRHELLLHYPHLSDWLATTAKFDPQHLLVNPYVARHIFDEHAAGRQGVFRKSKM